MLAEMVVVLYNIVDRAYILIDGTVIKEGGPDDIVSDPVVRSRENLEVARRHGKPVVVMEPVKGGLLANPPDSVAEILRRAAPSASFAGSMNAGRLPAWYRLMARST